MKTKRMSRKRKGFILAFLTPTVIAFVLSYCDGFSYFIL